MILQLPLLTAMVRSRLGLPPKPSLLIPEIDTDQAEIGTIIRANVEEVARQVYLSSTPAHLCGSGHTFGDSDIFWHPEMRGTFSGHIMLPDDFLRLTAFKMDDWSCTVYTAIEPSSPAFVLCYSQFPGIRGEPERPVVTITPEPEGQMLTFYSCRSTSACISKAAYVAAPRIAADGSIEIATDCVQPLVSTLADIIHNLRT